MKMEKSFSLKIALMALCMLFSANIFAQFAVSGTVLDDMGEGAVGASVREKGTTNGVATDINGNFKLTVKSSTAVLQISYVGFKSQEVKIGGRKTIKVNLVSDNMLNEVVTVGYGTMKKSDLAGASASLGENALKEAHVTNLDQAFLGRVTGVSAVQTSGAPGSSSSIRVRGQATINAGAEPLYVIDGVIVQTGGQSGADFGLGDKLGNGSVSTISPIANINPSDIVSMEILKDASATAIYGAQGANGVVLITTKRGKAGQAKFTYDVTTNWSRQGKRLDMLNLREFAEYYNDLVNQGELYNPDPAYSDPSVLGKGTNWQDAIFRTAFQHQHQIGVQGGTEDVKYYVSGGFMNQEGTLVGSDFQRYSMRSNIDANLKPWLKMGLNVSYSRTKDNLLKADQDEGIINYSLTTPPDIQIYNIDGGYSSVSKEGFTNPNPIAMALMNDINLERQKLNGNVFFDVTPIKNLTWHTELGWDLGWNHAETFNPTVNLGTYHLTKNEGREQKNTNTYWTLKNYVTYNGKIDKHSFTAMVGQEAWESKWSYVSIFNTGMPLDIVKNPALGTGDPQIGYGFGSAAMASFFTRETYNYDNRYLLTYTYRYDGSSNFGPNKRWAGFHSLAAAWRFSEEKFFENLKDKGIITNGKLRIGWGQTGNSNIGGYKWGSAMSVMESALGTSYRPANIKNLDIKWETQEQLNLGLDLNLFNDRVNLVVDLYKKTSNDMLMQLILPSFMGTSGNGSSALAAPWGNYGAIENKGLEIAVNTRPVVAKDFSWNSDFQISFNRNKLKSLSNSTALIGYGMWTDVVSRSVVGESLYNFYGYEVEGVYQDFDDIKNSPVNLLTQNNPILTFYKQNDAGEFILDDDGNKIIDHYEWSQNADEYSRANTTFVGDIKFKDVNHDGVIDVNDKTNIGSPLPKFVFGWNNTFQYKNWDLSIFINGSVGNKVGNYMKMKLTHMNSAWTNQMTDVINRTKLAAIDPSKPEWYNDVNNVVVVNPGSSIPRATINDPNDNDAWSSRYIEDGSYVRLKNITLGYTFSDKLIQKWGLSNLRVNVSATNLWTITGYDGYDPEIGASTASANVFGLDNGRYPSPTSVSCGLSVSF